jgi:hypothetical protein
LACDSAQRIIEIHNAQLKECTKKAPPFGRAVGLVPVHVVLLYAV